MKISRPTMISVLNKNTRGLTHMNRKQMWKIIEEERLTDKAFELEKSVKRKPGSTRIARKSVEVVDLDTNETKYFPSLSEASKYYGKTKICFIYNNGRVWENKKITIIMINLLFPQEFSPPFMGERIFLLILIKFFKLNKNFTLS